MERFTFSGTKRKVYRQGQYYHLRRACRCSRKPAHRFRHGSCQKVSQCGRKADAPPLPLAGHNNSFGWLYLTAGCSGGGFISRNTTGQSRSSTKHRRPTTLARPLRAASLVQLIRRFIGISFPECSDLTHVPNRYAWPLQHFAIWPMSHFRRVGCAGAVPA